MSEAMSGGSAVSKGIFALSLGLGAAAIGFAADAQESKRTPAPSGAYVYFHYPLNGSTVLSRFKVRIGLRNMGVAPAGTQRAGTGHHHLLIDTELKSFDVPIPNDAQHLHLGNGQTEVEVTLPPGRHRLQLVVGDHDHVVHRPPVISAPITITVRDQDTAGLQ
jgi:hypothetical protein